MESDAIASEAPVTNPMGPDHRILPVAPARSERMIPIRPGDLTRRLLAEPGLNAAEQTQFERFGRLLGAVFHHEFHSWLQELKDLYAPLDPDSDCVGSLAGTIEHSEEIDETFLQSFEAALIRANYRPLDLTAIEKAIEAPNELGLNYVPNFDLFEHLKIYVRGQTEVARSVRKIQHAFRRREVQYNAYQRLVIILKFKPSQSVNLGPFVRDDVLYLRLFKDVPHVDMEMHLPEQGTKVVMRPIDKAQIASPLVVGLPSFAIKLLTAALLNPIAIGAVMAVPISAGLNSFFGHQRTKQKHLHHMIRNLYYLTLANNASVIRNIIDAAEEEEYKEALLAYFFLWQGRDDPEPWTRARLDARIEAYIRETTGRTVNFEIGDALGKLRRLDLLQGDDPHARAVVPIDLALQILDTRWDNLFPYHKPAPLPITPLSLGEV